MSKKMRTLLYILFVAILFIMFLTACSSKDNIVGRWDFSEANWDYDWIEFYEEGAYADSWGNPRTYTVPTDGQVMVKSQLDGFTFVWDYEVNGDTIVITDNGKEVLGRRVK